MLGTFWSESKTVASALLRAFVSGTGRALPWTVGACVLTGGVVYAGVVRLAGIAAAETASDSSSLLAFYLVVGLIGGVLYAVRRGLVSLLETAEQQAQRLIGPIIDRLLDQIPLGSLDGDPRELKAAVERALSAPLGGGALLQRQLRRLAAAVTADRSGVFMHSFRDEPGLTAREHLRNALLRYASAQQHTSLGATWCAVTGAMAFFWALPPLAIYLLGR